MRDALAFLSFVVGLLLSCVTVATGYIMTGQLVVDDARALLLNSGPASFAVGMVAMVALAWIAAHALAFAINTLTDSFDAA